MVTSCLSNCSFSCAVVRFLLFNSWPDDLLSDALSDIVNIAVLFSLSHRGQIVVLVCFNLYLCSLFSHKLEYDLEVNVLVFLFS